jgi:hypothetical protein
MTLEKLYEHGSFAIVAGIVQPLQITEFLLAGLHDRGETEAICPAPASLVGLHDRGETEAILRCELLGFLCIAIADDE